jgi:putative mRNA 3-end processing factor
MAAAGVERWLYPTEKGLYCEPGDFYIDPSRAVSRAIITHGHSDHARPGHQAVLATRETIEVMKVRMGPEGARSFEVFDAGTTKRNGARAVVSGDYKRQPDPTCAPFELVPCDVFVTEATFALPVFRHEPADGEVRRLLNSMAANPERTHLVGVYGLGKCQRLIKLCRQAGYDGPVYLHGALVELTKLYQRLGVDLGEIGHIDPAARSTKSSKSEGYAGALVLCPPSAVDDRWSRRFNDPVTSFASGWMRIRGRIRQAGVQLPLVISDHADWPELLDTIVATGAEEVWVTHGREDALVYQLGLMGRKARALALVGFEDEAE